MIYYIIFHVLCGLYAIGIQERSEQEKYKLIYDDIKNLRQFFMFIEILFGPIAFISNALENRSIKIALPISKNLKWDMYSGKWVHKCEFAKTSQTFKQINDANQAIHEKHNSLDTSKYDDFLATLNKIIDSYS